MRFLLPLVALCALASVPLRADMFDITLTGTFSGSGTFTTDGICSVCFSGGMGLLSLTINIGPDSGTDAFDLSDDSSASAGYSRFTGHFMYRGGNSENIGDFLTMISVGEAWELIRPGLPGGTGTYSITPAPVPEPSYLFLLMPIVALVGLRWRHQRVLRDMPGICIFSKFLSSPNFPARSPHFPSDRYNDR